jgi:hypothetical protein
MHSIRAFLYLESNRLMKHLMIGPAGHVALPRFQSIWLEPVQRVFGRAG